MAVIGILEHRNNWIFFKGRHLLTHELQLYRVSKQKKVNLHIFLFCEEHMISNAAYKCSNILQRLHEEFWRLLKDFLKVGHEIQLLTCPFAFDVEKAQGNLQAELIDMSE